MQFIGLTNEQVEQNRSEFGSNDLTQIPPEPLWKKIINGFKDPMIMILMAALVIQVILFLLGQAEWFEPAGILVAIIIANGAAAVSESKQEGKASALKAEAESGETAKLIRSGKLRQLNISEVVAGDIVFLQAGDKIPADGIIFEGSIKVDQSSLNGETEEAGKHPSDSDEGFNDKDLLNTYSLYRGTVVTAGEGYMKVSVVGDRTIFGKLALEVQEDTRETPLQIKLGKLAKQISAFGYIGAVCIIAGILIRTVVTGEMPADLYSWIRHIMDAVTVAVTIIVCAVPEGLPMLTSLLMSFQSIKMAKDNVLVRKINGLETSGSISLLFSDKTGTITQGILTVSELATGNVRVFRNLNNIPESYKNDIVTGIGLNNSASASGGKVIGGNSTDRALMSFLMGINEEDSFTKQEVRAFDPFDSTRKTSTVTVAVKGKSVTYIKGAPERILDRCTHYIDLDGSLKELTEINYLNSYINTQAGRSMRLLAVAKSDPSISEDKLVLIAMISIRDNVRKEAADAISEVQNAGIQVVMVTGDRKETAVAIAKEAGLLKKDSDIALTSSEMAELSDEELKHILPDLRVVSRALPADKSRLVRIAQEMDHVVGMTGDGVNDSPALRKADVGFAMGSGTEVAKEAGDITILDDNFSSIEKAILYGRTMFRSIRKFLIFQLTVNVSAVLICFLAPMLGINVALTVVQLLLINLAMDTLAAVAYGSEPADREYMKYKPVPRREGIITGAMLAQFLTSAAYITIICLCILFLPQVKGMFGDVDITYLRSAMFAVFMMSITFNGFNARTENINIFKGIGRNRNFLIIMAAIFVMQFVFVTFGGEVLSVERLRPDTWGLCILLALPVIPIDLIRKILILRRD